MPHDHAECVDVFNTFCGRDRAISVKELGRALRSLGYFYSKHDLRDILKDFDEDGSGSLDFDEFSQIIAAINEMEEEMESDEESEEDMDTGMFQQVYNAPGASSSRKKEIHKAVFIGINYIGTSAELKGCVNDVRTMRNLLEKQLKYSIAESRILVENSSFPGCSGMPTRENIVQAFRWLVQGAKPGDVLFLHYSGHGTSVPERVAHSEESGKDQAICPMDYARSGVIIDDDINSMISMHLPPGVRLTAVFDCCHSGSIMDLPYMLNTAQHHQVQQKGQSQGIAASIIMFSGCRDDQTSADTFAQGVAGGALTFAMSDVLSTNSGENIQQLLEAMRHSLRGRYSQVPQLSSSQPFNSSGKFSFMGATVEEL